MMNQIHKLVFLDIDGTLNSSRSELARLGCDITEEDRVFFGRVPAQVEHSIKTVDPIAVALVNKLLAPDVGLVLVSSHRKFFHQGLYKSPEHLLKLRKYLEILGVQVPEFFSITEHLNIHRGEEVQLFISECDLDVQASVIIDDEADYKPLQPHVRVDSSIGVSLENFTDACKYLAV